MRIHFWLTVLATLAFLIVWLMAWLDATRPATLDGWSYERTILWLVFSLSLYVAAIVMIWSHALLRYRRPVSREE